MTSLSKKISTLMLITMLIISNISIVFADSDDLSNYYQLNFIQSSGTQYIDTGYFINGLTDIEVKAQFTSTPSSNVFLFGTSSYNSDSTKRHNFGLSFRTTANTKYSVYNGQKWSSFEQFGSFDLNPNVFRLNRSTNKFYVNNNEYSLDNDSISSINTSLILFGSRQSNTSSLNPDYFVSARIYYLKIYENNQLLYNYIPVERISDGEVGLYETINNIFYSNQGSGVFTSGTKIFNVVTNISPSGSGSVTGGGEYLDGSSVTLTATPNIGYIFNGWSDGSKNNPYTFTVTSGLNITANFVPIQNTVTITTSVSPEGSGTVTGGGQYDDGDYVTLTAIPNEGYTFKNWSDGIIANPRSLTVHSDETFIAYFEEEQSEYDVLLSVYPEGYGTVTGSGTYEAGQTIQISAEAEEGYEFVSWSDGSIANPRDITVNSNINLTANFRVQQDIPVIDEDNILLIVLLLSFLILINIGKGEIYNG